MKSIIVEDYRLAREGLARMLGSHPEIELVGTAECVTSAYELIMQYSPELIFLDIHLPEGSGFSLVSMLDYEPKIIFTTAYSEYAIRSFDYNTVDYLLKPISKQRLQQALAKIDKQAVDASSAERLSLESRLLLKNNNSCDVVSVADIELVESCGNYVAIYTKKSKFLSKNPLAYIEQRFPVNEFIRVSRSYIVNVNYINRIEDGIGSEYFLNMQDGRCIEITKTGMSKLRQIMQL